MLPEPRILRWTPRNGDVTYFWGRSVRSLANLLAVKVESECLGTFDLNLVWRRAVRE